MRSSLYAEAVDGADYVSRSAQSKRGASPAELTPSKLSLDDVIVVTHVRAKVDPHGTALHLINRRPEREIAFEYDELPPTLLPAAATETANAGLVCHSKRQDPRRRLARLRCRDETPDGTNAPFVRCRLSSEFLMV